MRNRNVRFLILIHVFFLCRCYESEVPLSREPSSRVDTRLVGSWISISGENQQEAVSLVIRKFNENEYWVAWREGVDDKTVIARGYDTRMGTTTIINLQNVRSLEERERTYVFFRHDFDENANLVVRILSDEYAGLKGKTFKSSEDLNRFVRKNLSREGLFGASIEFMPAKEIDLEIIL